MTLDEIEAFVAVAESGSVNRAARHLRLSQPAVTRRLQRFEEALGRSLFDRRTKPLGLTHAGRDALDHCRQVLKAAARLQPGPTASDTVMGECRVGISQGLLDVGIAEPLDRVRAAFPRLKVRISSGSSPALVQEAREGGLELAVVHRGIEEGLPRGVSGRLIARERLVVIASRRSPLPSVVTPADLGGATWVLSSEGQASRGSLRQLLAGVEAPLKVAIEAVGSELRLSLVALGAGLGLVPERWVLRSPVRQQLRVLRVRGHDLRLGVWTVRGQDAGALAPAVDALEEELTRALRPKRSP
ncbi:MAG: LysR family transcriptional regulator [Candidatus Rokubacteria bacterium]|nr:LysR family transcriptional regulator [Candidatus Rokubacteria bacterium]